MNLLLKLKNGNKEELTLSEARELYNELHQIFGEKTAPLTWPTIGERTFPETLESPPQTWCGPAKGSS